MVSGLKSQYNSKNKCSNEQHEETPKLNDKNRDASICTAMLITTKDPVKYVMTMIKSEDIGKIFHI